MTVVVWMEKCIFCGFGHYTDQECFDNQSSKEVNNGNRRTIRQHD
jgi:hypothetical protein